MEFKELVKALRDTKYNSHQQLHMDIEKKVFGSNSGITAQGRKNQITKWIKGTSKPRPHVEAAVIKLAKDKGVIV